MIDAFVTTSYPALVKQSAQQKKQMHIVPDDKWEGAEIWCFSRRPTYSIEAQEKVAYYNTVSSLCLLALKAATMLLTMCVREANTGQF